MYTALILDNCFVLLYLKVSSLIFLHFFAIAFIVIFFFLTESSAALAKRGSNKDLEEGELAEVPSTHKVFFYNG